MPKHIRLETLALERNGSIAIGPFGSALKADQYTEVGVPVLRGQNLTPNRTIEGPFVYVADDDAQRLRRSLVNANDLVFPHRGAIGEVGIIPRDRVFLLSSSMMKISIDPSKADPQFLYYYFRGQGRQELENRASTVGTPGIAQPLASLRSIVVPLFPLSTQVGIGRTLGLLDDKIEANAKLAHIADELASALYLEATQNSAEMRSYEDLAIISGGGTPSTKNDAYWNGTINWATPTDVTNLSHPYLFGTSRRVTELGLQTCSSVLYPRGTILMTSRATIGAFAIAQEETAVNQGFITVQAIEPDLQHWLYFDMKSRVDEFKQWSNGATFLELSRKNFKQLPVAVPTAEVLSSFSEQVAPLLQQAISFVTENKKLEGLRDYLLPRLMSGKISVKDAEQLLP